MHTAVFIGGEYDLTKRVLQSEQHEVLFHSRFSDQNSFIGMPKVDDYIFNTLVYRLQYKTYEGVLIYEFVGSYNNDVAGANNDT